MRGEALAAARLKHPHVADVYDYGEEAVDGRAAPHIVMELVEGVTAAAAADVTDGFIGEPVG